MKFNILQKLKEILPKVKQKLKIYFTFLVAIVIFFAIFSIGANLFSYFDPLTFCYIGIENDFLKGNQKTVKEAIGLLKKEDIQSYKTLCKNVDTIVEEYCRAADPRVRGQEVGIDELGCYIRGSKVIYLIPTKTDNQFVINQRSETIKKYAYFSKNFWDDY